MKALILANRSDNQKLFPFTTRRPHALLPVAGKPLVEYAIESIADAGIKDMTIVTPGSKDQFRQILGDGGQWGVKLNVLSTDEFIAEDLIQLNNQRHEWLIARGDILWDCPVSQFLHSAKESALPMVYATACGNGFGLLLLRRPVRPEMLFELAVPRPFALGEGIDAVAFDERDARFIGMESINEYHQANLEAAAGAFRRLVLPGYEVEPGIRCASGARWDRKSIKGRSVLIGPYCRVDKTAEIRGHTVLSGGVIIDRNVTLDRTVVLPDTYVGEQLDVSNCIVSGQHIVNVEIGGAINIVDSFLLSDIRRKPSAKRLFSFSKRGPLPTCVRV
jgi:NDP-sugar pyrophosphorylase family protein